ncbi:hypothetical protein BH11BAC3_BH11BAC3_13220 [soil metagenome]
MGKSILLIIFFFLATTLFAQSNKVVVKANNDGMKLEVNGNDFMINGINWDYFPIGTNFNYSLWKQPDDIISAALDREMSMLKNMGINTIRQYTGVPPKWIKYIYENYGIYTMLNHSFGRYGLTLNGSWYPNTDYADSRVQALLLKEVKDMTEEYKNTPGVLMFLLGNENDYGLFWRGAETENVPMDERKSTKGAQSLYKLFNDATIAIKSIDKSHPVAICNGELLFLDIIAKECKDIDILGLNMYRGISFGDAFDRVKKEYGKPIMFSEFGSDAYNAQSNQEAQQDQAKFDLANWKEIYENAAGMGKAGNCLGGFTFQFSDGWWKYKQTSNLDVHDENASWSNGGYSFDFKPGENNMNEEWFGICAKGPTDQRGLYQLYPRAAYYALQEAHKFNPFLPGNTAQSLQTYFNGIQMADMVLKARGDAAALESESKSKIRLSTLRMDLTTYNTGGTLITTPSQAVSGSTTYPDKLGFDRMESYYVGVEANPAPNMKANVTFNILGNVAKNPIDEIFYENRGLPQTVYTTNGLVTQTDNNRVQVYSASYEWNAKQFDLRGFYRTGHYHWGYEGDFFGLYPEANYGPNLDIYNGEISGAEIDGKKAFKGLKAAFGPQLWWGANPAFLLKYEHKFGRFDIAGVYHEDIEKAGVGVATSSIAIPLPKTRRATVYAKTSIGALGIELGGIWGGQPLNGRAFQYVTGSLGKYIIYNDFITWKDNWGAKVKFTFSKGAFNWYAQAASMGLVANGGADNTKTFTGWRLKDCGCGNQNNVLTGFTYNINNFQIAPNFLWQKPIIGPIPAAIQAPGRLRNIIDDPFAVRSNRETLGGELLLSYDPTPATWMYEWNNDEAEDAKFAFNVDLIYRNLPTTQDASIGFTQKRASYAFPASAPAHDLWEVNTRIVSKLTPSFGIIANLFAGNGQANGSDARLITHRYGGDVRVVYKKMKFVFTGKFNDWGPFDYYRDFNLTFPVQLILDVSTSLGKPGWFLLPNTRVGVQGTWRSLDQYSPRYSPTNTFLPNTFPPQPVLSPVGFPNGSEWEIRTYVKINVGK